MSTSRRPARAALALVLALLASCTRRPAADAAPRTAGLPSPDAVSLSAAQSVPPEIGDGWRTASPEAVGLDAARLAAMTEAIRRQEYANVHAVLIEKDGRLVYEQYFAGTDERGGPPKHIVFARDSMHSLRSVTKSVVSALVGAALDAGAIRSLDQPLYDFFPEHADLVTPEKRLITLRHALTMSAGLEWHEGDVPYTDPRNDEGGMVRSSDPVRFVLARPLVEPPGTRWNYSGGLTQVLAAVVERATRRPLLDYARATLFDPLGARAVWREIRPGVSNAASGLILRPRDLAKFGSLYLHGGRWNGRQVLPAEWVTESTRRRIAVKDSVWSLGETGYGYHWWHDRFKTDGGMAESLSAVGNGQQRIFVLPQLRLVVTLLAGRYNDKSAESLAERLLLRHIVPAALPRSAAAPEGRAIP